MYNVHQWYMQAYELGHSDWIGVRVWDHHYFRGNQTMWI
jgi:hypothetical protein